MGIQDRDYYWKKHQHARNSSNNGFNYDTYRHKPTHRNAGSLKYLLVPALMLFGLWLGADSLLKQRTTHQSSLALSVPGVSKPVSTPISGGLELTADRQGHFRGTVLINNVPMPFLIDTGATVTSIPAKLAQAAKLPVGIPVNSKTAGGKVIDRLTRITSLKIGNAEIKNLDATINQHLEEVLIGMNTLKYFTTTQNSNTMTLVANGSLPEHIVRATVISPTPMQPNTLTTDQPISTPPIKQPTTIKRTVSCDANHVCTTKYSDR